MASPKIIPKKSTIAERVPVSGDLDAGEICINHADKKLYAKHPSTGVIQEIGSLSAHSHDELYSLDNSQHIELQNNGALVLNGSTTLTLPSASGTLALLDDVSGGGVSTTPANSGLTITDDSITTVYNTAVPDATVSMAVGGASAAAASAWKTKTVVQVLDEILFPTVLASIGTNKSVSLAVSGTSGVLEIGESYSRTLTATFNRGTILNGSGTTNSNLLVGAVEDYTFTGTGISSTTQTGNTLSFTSTVVSGSNNWAVTATHGAGSGAYFDNKGVAGTNLNGSRVAGSATDSSSSPTITGLHPYYYYKSSSPITSAAMVAAIEGGTATKVIASSTGTLSIPYAVTAQYLAVAYPTTSTLKTRFFVTVSDADVITVVFQAVTTPSVTTALWTQTYNVHVSKSALTNTNTIIELRNS
jgi:hypothetical protein